MKLSTLKLVILFAIIGCGMTASAQAIDTTKYYVLTSKQLGEKLALTGMVDATLGNKVMLRSASDHPMQQWIFEQQKLGYRIYCREFGRDYSLEVVNQGSNSNSVSMGKTIENASNQIWKVARSSDGSYIFRSLWQDKVIDVIKSGDQTNQLILIQTDNIIDYPTWQLAGTPRPKRVTPVMVSPPTTPAVVQTATIVKPLLDTAKTYRIVTSEMPGKAVGVNYSRYTEIMLMPINPNSAMEWKITMTASGLYMFANVQSNNQKLEVKLAPGENKEVILGNPRDANEQLWKIVLAPQGGYQITSPVTGSTISLDFVEDGEDNSPIQLRGFNSTLWSLVPVSSAPTPIQPAAIAAPVPTNKNKLMPGEQLKVNQKIFSANGAYSLVQQSDGNLVVNDAQNMTIWASGLGGQHARRCLMQEDGNLAQHPDGYNQVMWSTQTKGNNGAYAMLQDDGVLVVVNKINQIIWRSKAAVVEVSTPVSPEPQPVVEATKPGPVETKPTVTANNNLKSGQELHPGQSITSANGRFKLIQQDDGNLVVYEGNRPVWATGTNGERIQRCVMQRDGNLVLYDLFRDAKWASNTHGNEDAYLVLTDEGVIMIVSRDNQIIWRSKS